MRIEHLQTLNCIVGRWPNATLAYLGEVDSVGWVEGIFFTGQWWDVYCLEGRPTAPKPFISLDQRLFRSEGVFHRYDLRLAREV